MGFNGIKLANMTAPPGSINLSLPVIVTGLKCALEPTKKERTAQLQIFSMFANDAATYNEWLG